MSLRLFVFCVTYTALVRAARIDLGLDGLGDRISASVQQGLAPLENLNQNIQANIDSLHLDTLGDRITQNVELSLRPVRALEIISKMSSGIGGTTIMTLEPSGRKFLVRGSNLYECPSGLSESGKCGGELKRFQFKNKEDYCFISSKSQTNNYLCLSEGPISFSVYNNRYSCEGLDPNIPALLISTDDYKKMCEKVAGKIIYKYIADKNDPLHVQIPNSNPYVKCQNREEGVCVFEKPWPVSGSNVQISGGPGSSVQFSDQNGNVQYNGYYGSFNSF